MKLGHFTAEALQEFAETKGLDTKNQDFSEGVFDFKVCERPNGKRYGIPDQDECKAPNREAKEAPLSVLGLNVGAKQNYDTAKAQGEAKNVVRRFRDIMGGNNIKTKELNSQRETLNALGGSLDFYKESNKKLWLKAEAKHLNDHANLCESTAKALKPLVDKVPDDAKPLLRKIIDLEAQLAYVMRNQAGLDSFNVDGVYDNPTEGKEKEKNAKETTRIEDELSNKLYPTMRQRLGAIPVAREKNK